MSDYTVKSIVFFEKPKYQGRGFGIKNKPIFNTEDIAELNNIFATAKSVMIVPRSPYEPYDPNW